MTVFLAAQYINAFSKQTFHSYSFVYSGDYSLRMRNFIRHPTQLKLFKHCDWMMR